MKIKKVKPSNQGWRNFLLERGREQPPTKNSKAKSKKKEAPVKKRNKRTKKEGEEEPWNL